MKKNFFANLWLTFHSWSLFNYDDEPSVSKGIMSQLPSYHLPFTECQPSS